MKGGVNQGVGHAVKLCGNLTWVRSSHSYDQYNPEAIENNKTLKDSDKVGKFRSINPIIEVVTPLLLETV